MVFFDHALWLLVAALILDAAVGDPDWLWKRLPHPVVLFGKAIGAMDRRLNRSFFSPTQRRAGGIATLIVLVASAGFLGWALQTGFDRLPFGEALTVAVAAVFIAHNSLYRHVARVRDALTADGLSAGRKAVSMIVGRDPARLDEAGVSRAAIESGAENFSDGVVAPAFWFALLGLPGLIAYKAINTADSMIGHKNETYQDYGWAAARFDDLVNLPAARLSGLLIAIAAPLAGGSAFKSLRAIWNDAAKHRSPNAGWPEAAMAGALDLALAGPRTYAGYVVDDPYMNPAGRIDATARDIGRSLKILNGAWATMVAGALAAAAAL